MGAKGISKKSLCQPEIQSWDKNIEKEGKQKELQKEESAAAKGKSKKNDFLTASLRREDFLIQSGTEEFGVRCKQSTGPEALHAEISTVSMTSIRDHTRESSFTGTEERRGREAKESLAIWISSSDEDEEEGEKKEPQNPLSFSTGSGISHRFLPSCKEMSLFNWKCPDPSLESDKREAEETLQKLFPPAKGSSSTRRRYLSSGKKTFATEKNSEEKKNAGEKKNVAFRGLISPLVTTIFSSEKDKKHDDKTCFLSTYSVCGSNGRGGNKKHREDYHTLKFESLNSIRILYSMDLNLMEIHRILRARFLFLSQMLPILELEKKNLLEKIGKKDSRIAEEEKNNGENGKNTEDNEKDREKVENEKDEEKEREKVENGKDEEKETEKLENEKDEEKELEKQKNGKDEEKELEKQKTTKKNSSEEKKNKKLKKFELDEKKKREIVPVVDLVNWSKEADLLDQRIESIRSGSAWNKYQKHGMIWVEQYWKCTDRLFLLSESQKENGTADSSEGKMELENLLRERLRIIRQFLDLCSQFIEIHAHMESFDTTECLFCGKRSRRASSSTLSSSQIAAAAAEIQDPEDLFLSEYGTQVCECGRETIAVACFSTFRDISRLDLGNRNNYNDLINFVKRLDAYEGLQKTRPPDTLYGQLDRYFVENSLTLPAKHIRENLPILADGKKEGTSIEILAAGLLATNNSSYYKDLELIAHLLWGWRLADLTASGLRTILINDYVLTQRVYHEIKERDSSLNVNLRLFFHLKARDYPCILKDFKIISCEESLEYHSRMFRIMCERTGLKFTPFL